MQVVDTGKDLNAYAKVENQAGCCSPAMARRRGLPLAELLLPQRAGETTSVHEGLADCCRSYNVNEYAASVQVYAVKAR